MENKKGWGGKRKWWRRGQRGQRETDANFEERLPFILHTQGH